MMGVREDMYSHQQRVAALMLALSVIPHTTRATVHL